MELRKEWKWLVLLAVVCGIAFSGAVGGEFIYDDVRQIERNGLIQDNSLIWKALTSDVWAAKGGGSITVSNNWRPLLTAWQIVNFRLFGPEPAGWHVTNIILHAGVCILVFGLLRRLELSAAAAFSVALVFAVHPVHVECVAWITGFPDMLFSLFFLGSLWMAVIYRQNGSLLFLALTVLLYGLALGTKEIGILCLPIYYLVLAGERPEGSKVRAIAVPLVSLAAVAAVYLVLRWYILGFISRSPDDAPSLAATVVTLPLIFAFYLRQIFFPYWMAFNYPVGPVGYPTFLNFILPALISAAVLTALLIVGKKIEKARIGIAIFLLPLIPAMNVTAFSADQMVHDRYIYLPLLGILMVLVLVAAKYVSDRTLVAAAVVISIPLMAQTFQYSKAVATEVSVWERTAQVDDSSFTMTQLGAALTDAGRPEEAIDAYTRALNKKAAPRAYLGRGMNLMKLQRFEEAESDLAKAMYFQDERIEPIALYQTYRTLGMTYVEQGKHNEAIRLFSSGRNVLPMYAAAMTVDLSIVLYQTGQKETALRELERVRDRARNELLPESKEVFFRLGSLYLEAGMKNEARAALAEYLDASRTFTNRYTQEYRAEAERILGTLK